MADLAVDPIQGVHEQRPPLAGSWVARNRVPVARAGLLVLEELPDLREGEPGVVAEPADEPEALQVLRVVEAVGTADRAAGASRPISS